VHQLFLFPEQHHACTVEKQEHKEEFNNIIIQEFTAVGPQWCKDHHHKCNGPDKFEIKNVAFEVHDT